MVAIPVSQGPRVSPQASPNAVAPSMQQASLIGNSVAALGDTVSKVAAQRIEFDTRRTQALQSAKALDYSSKIKDIDNQFELAAQQVPSTPDQFGNMSEKFSKDRDKTIQQLLDQEQDPVVRDLAQRHAVNSSVDLRDKFNRFQLSKEAEYGQHVITTRLDDIGERLLKTSDPRTINALNSEMNVVLKSGIQARYIDFNFVERYQDKQQQIAAKREAEYTQREALNSYLDGTAFADPNNAADRKLVDGAFKRMIESQDPNLQAQAVKLAGKTGIVPSQLVSEISGRLTVGTPEQKVKAAQIIGDLITENPRLVSAFPASTQAMATVINNSIEAGVSSQKAVEFAEKDIKENKSFDRSRREQTYNLDSSKKVREERVQKVSSELADQGMFSFDAQVPDAVIGQHEFLTKEYYMNEGLSMEAASAQATKIIKSQWGVTEIGGKKRLQKYSPEAVYSVPGVSNKWIRDQAVETVRSTGLFPEASSKEVNKNIELHPDPDSIYSGKPSYLVTTVVNEYGLRDIVRDEKNQPVRFTPDFSKTDHYKKSVAARDALSITPEEFAQRIYKSRKNETASPSTPYFKGQFNDGGIIK